MDDKAKKLAELYRQERDKLSPFPDSDEDGIALFNAYEILNNQNKKPPA